MEDDLNWTQIRCPQSNGPQELLMKTNIEDNLLELQCSFCTRMKRKEDSKVVRVCHRYNVLGLFVETVTTRVD